MFGWQDPGLTFDVALHIGTLLAVLAYFWRDWLELIGGMTGSFSSRRRVKEPQSRLFWLLIIASIPGAIAGALGESAAETSLRAPAIVATLMIVGGVLHLTPAIHSHVWLEAAINKLKIQIIFALPIITTGGQRAAKKECLVFVMARYTSITTITAIL
jgi:undecaprenyl pyrophosphate phosphatase UppP